jgi:hypothetical protein
MGIEEYRWRGGRGYRQLKFTYEDIARIKGVSLQAVRRAVSNGILDPDDLESICRYLQMRRGGKRNE